MWNLHQAEGGVIGPTDNALRTFFVLMQRRGFAVRCWHLGGGLFQYLIVWPYKHSPPMPVPDWEGYYW